MDHTRLLKYNKVLQSILKSSDLDPLISSLLKQSSSTIAPVLYNHSVQQPKDEEEQIKSQILAQINHFLPFSSKLQMYASQNNIPFNNVFESYWNYVLPYFQNILVSQKYLQSPLIVGVLGVQGAGKTTLSSLLALLCEDNNLRSMVFSIDDFYLPYSERQKLQQIDPRFQYRGPPGTHDVDSLKKIFSDIKNKCLPIKVPMFDKSLFEGQGDRSGYTNYEYFPQIVVLEGWFTGLKSTTELKQISPLQSQQDMEFAQCCREKLKLYEEVWEYLDEQIVITPINFQYSREWRKLAEHKMIARTGRGMSDKQIDEFVDYFWKSLHPEIYVNEFISKSDNYDLLITLDLNHNITKIEEGSKSQIKIKENDKL